jgi:copper chaperone
MKNLLFKIEGMSCNHCVMAVKKELEKLPISSLDVKLGQAEICYDETKVNEIQIKAAIRASGYNVI